jgi:hypothetical protein
MSEMSREQLQEMLPWYVNETLPAQLRSEIDRALAGDAESRDVLAFLKDVRTAMRLDRTSFNEQASLAGLLARVGAQPVPAVVRGSSSSGLHSWISALLEFFQPKLAVAAAVILAQALVIGGLVYRAQTPVYSEVRSQDPGVTASTGPVFRVTFRPDARESEIRKLLISAGARIVSGPTQLGDYYLTLQLDNRAQALGTSTLVDSIKRLDQLPSELEPQR